MRKKRNKKRSNHPRASVVAPPGRWSKKRPRIIEPQPERPPAPNGPAVAITKSLDADHDPDRCASCQWRAENQPGGFVLHGGVAKRLEISDVPRIVVHVTGGGPGFEPLAAGIELFVPDRAKLATVLEVVFLENPRIEVPWFHIELLVNGIPRSGEHRVAAGDTITIRRFPDA